MNIWKDLHLQDVVPPRVYVPLGAWLGRNGENVHLHPGGFMKIYEVLARRTAGAAYRVANEQLASLYDKYGSYGIWLKKRQEQVKNFTAQRETKLVEAQKAALNNYGIVEYKNGVSIVHRDSARDISGDPVPTALVLFYDRADTIDVTTQVIAGDNTDATSSTGLPAESGAASSRSVTKTFKTTTIAHTDTVATVTAKSGKNVVMTKVQGRDCTRKEMIGGEDVTFSVSGMIDSRKEGVYPDSQVRKFLEIMNYKGIVNVNHYLFGQFGVDRVVILDYSLDKQEYLNLQPYSFTCVGVEPDESVSVKADTLNLLEEEMATTDSRAETWYKALLNEKLGKAFLGAADTVTGGTIAI